MSKSISACLANITTKVTILPKPLPISIRNLYYSNLGRLIIFPLVFSIGRLNCSIKNTEGSVPELDTNISPNIVISV